MKTGLPFRRNCWESLSGLLLPVSVMLVAIVLRQTERGHATVTKPKGVCVLSVALPLRFTMVFMS